MKKAIVICLLILSVNFWGYVGISDKFHLATNFLSAGVLGLFFFITMRKKDLRFRGPILLVMFGIALNILSSSINYDQNPFHTLMMFGSFFFLLSYFLLHELRPDLIFLENIILIFAIIFSVFYIIQVIAYPTPVFSKIMLEDRNTVRVRIKGNGFLVLGYFLMLSKYLIHRNLIHITLAAGFFIVLLMGGFRTLAIACLLLSLLTFIKLSGASLKNYLFLIPAILLFFGVFQLEGPSKILEGMMETSEGQLEKSDENIRLVALNYFYNEFPSNPSIFILGSGYPNSDKSQYARAFMVLQQQGIFWVDIGLLGFYIVIGLFATLGLIWFSLKAIFIKLPKKYLYLKVYFAYLLLVSFTTMEIFRDGIFGVEALVLYMIDVAKDEQESLKASFYRWRMLSN